jgi:hypothetical protein
MITINPNERFDNLESKEAKAMILRLQSLSDFLLKKKNIIAGLIYKDSSPKKRHLTLPLEREQFLNRIISISEDREGAVEWGTTHHKLHIHLEFIIEHRTFVSLNKPYYEKMASVILNKPEKKIHINFRGATRAEGYKKYVQKNAKEDAAHFFDKSATEFYKDETLIPVDQTDSE